MLRRSVSKGQKMSKVSSFVNSMMGTGGISLMRVLTFLVVGDIMTVWTLTCLKDLEITDIPWGAVSVIGVMVTGKAMQRFAESDTPCSPEENKADVKDATVARTGINKNSDQ